jgi:hypothetical protein
LRLGSRISGANSPRRDSGDRQRGRSWTKRSQTLCLHGITGWTYYHWKAKYGAMELANRSGSRTSKTRTGEAHRANANCHVRRRFDSCSIHTGRPCTAEDTRASLTISAQNMPQELSHSFAGAVIAALAGCLVARGHTPRRGRDSRRPEGSIASLLRRRGPGEDGVGRVRFDGGAARSAAYCGQFKRRHKITAARCRC